MKNDEPDWILEGVGVQARKAAQMAAPAAGLPVSVWLAKVIRQAAKEERLAALEADRRDRD